MSFFFSSRRRHTRWTGDWSSDVCSSDLATPSRETEVRAAALEALGALAWDVCDLDGLWRDSPTALHLAQLFPNGRSVKSDRKSTRLNSSHPSISYAVFCLKKKNKNENED